MNTIKSALFASVILFAFQNANARDTVTLDNPLNSLVLWQGQMKVDSSRKSQASSLRYYAQIDSVLFGSLPKRHRIWSMLHYMYKDNRCSLELNTNYVILSTTINLAAEGVGYLSGKCEDVLLDTPKNRQKLVKKVKNTTVIYKQPNPPLPKSYGDID